MRRARSPPTPLHSGTTGKLPTATPHNTDTTLATTPHAVLQSIHDGMPAILPPNAYAAWLDSAMRVVEPVQALLTPYPWATLLIYLLLRATWQSLPAPALSSS